MAIWGDEGVPELDETMVPRQEMMSFLFDDINHVYLMTMMNSVR